MSPFYEECCKDLEWTLDESLLQKMKKANSDKLKVLLLVLNSINKLLNSTLLQYFITFYYSSIGELFLNLLYIMWDSLIYL